MKVILLEDVEKLGKFGDVVDVKRGYARNYLFPRNVAIEAVDKNLKLIEERKRKRERQLTREKAETEELAKRIGNISYTIPMAAGEEDRLFGTVTVAHIAEAMAAEGIEIDKRKIHLVEPIQRLGVYQVEIKLHPELTTTIRVWVVKK